MAVISAASLVQIGVTEGTAEEFVAACVDAGLVDDSSRPVVEEFARDAARETPSIKAVLRQAEVSHEVLPSLVQLQATVDVRFSFEEDRVTASVPIVLVYIDTDAAHHEIWFQMTKRQVEKMIADLQGVLKNIEAAQRALPPIPGRGA
jgi:hypothetical protein